MSDNTHRTDTQKAHLTFSREFFADYRIGLLSKIRTCPECDAIYTGSQPHPLIELQKLNQQEILSYRIHLVSEEVLKSRPFGPTEEFITAVKHAAILANNRKPPLAKRWNEFIAKWKAYKSVQRKIYDTIVSTLRVGTSMHYARSVPYGYGMPLLNNILRDNQHNTNIGAYYDLFSSLFTLRMQPGELFEAYKRRFDLIINRLANCQPPITLPEQFLLFLVLRGLSTTTSYEMITQIIMARKNIDLSEALGILRDHECIMKSISV